MKIQASDFESLLIFEGFGRATPGQRTDSPLPSIFTCNDDVSFLVTDRQTDTILTEYPQIGTPPNRPIRQDGLLDYCPKTFGF